MTIGVLNGSPFNTLPANGPQSSAQLSAGWPWQTLPFQVPQVLASAWRSPAGEPGLILINWGRSTATWSGIWEPSEYGMSEVDSYTVAVATRAAPPPPVLVDGILTQAAPEDCSPTGVASYTQDWPSQTQLGATQMDWPSHSRTTVATTHDLDWTSNTTLGAVGTEIQSWPSQTRIGVAAAHTQDWSSQTRLGAEIPLSHTGTLRIRARGTLGTIANGEVEIGALPPHSITVVTFPSIGPRTGSGFDSGFSSGFGGSHAPVTGPLSFTSGFDEGFL